MFDVFPREFGKKRKIIHTKDLFLEYVNANNKRTDIFTNTFDFKSTVLINGKEKLDRSTIVIPHVLFDLDSEDCFCDMMKLHNYCLENNLAHYINCSGRGYHVYIVVEINPINTAIDVLLFQNKLIQELDIEVDTTCVGNPSHLIRVPGTYNLKRKHWCIGLKEEELTNHESILKLAEKQRLGTFLMSGEPLKLKHQKSSDVIPDLPEYAISKMDIDTSILIPCLRTNIRPGGYIPHQERVWIVQYLSEIYRNGKPAYKLDDTEFEYITRKIVDFFRNILVDFSERKTTYYVKGIIRNCEYSPSCKKLQLHGMCVKNKCYRRDF